MKIDINNYEAFFLDFVEGRLDNASALEMLTFLRNHPDLKEQLDNFTDVKLSPSKIVFHEKEILKKFDFSGAAINHKNFDDYCIAYYEKLLSPKDSERFLSYVNQDPKRKSGFIQYSKTILKADSSIVFEDKRFLKKKHVLGVRTIVLRWTAVAAGILLLVAVFYKSPVKENVVIPRQNMATTVNKPQKQTPIISRKEELSVKTRNYAQAGRKSTVVIDQINTPEQKHLTEEIELSYLRPKSSASVEGNEDIQRPKILKSSLNTTLAVTDTGDFELMDYAESMIKEKFFKSRKKNQKKLTLWDIAEVTLKGYNQISENDIILHRKTDENGKLTAIAIETENRMYGIETKN